MHEEVLGHIEFWTQFQRYLDDNKIQIRLSGSSKSSLRDLFLPRSYFRLRPSHLLKDNQLGVSVQFDGPGALARYESVAQQHRQKVNERLSPLGALDWQRSKILLNRSTTPSRPETWEERNAWMANAIETMRALFNEIFPPAPQLNLKFHGEKLVNSSTGEEYDVPTVAARLPWQAYKTHVERLSALHAAARIRPPRQVQLRRLGRVVLHMHEAPRELSSVLPRVPEPDAVLGAWEWLSLLAYGPPWRLDAEPLHSRLRRTTSPSQPGREADQAKRLARAALAAAGKRLASKLPKEAPRSGP